MVHSQYSAMKCSSACPYVASVQVVDILIYKGREELEVWCP